MIFSPRNVRFSDIYDLFTQKNGALIYYDYTQLQAAKMKKNKVILFFSPYILLKSLEREDRTLLLFHLRLFSREGPSIDFEKIGNANLMSRAI